LIRLIAPQPTRGPVAAWACFAVASAGAAGVIARKPDTHLAVPLALAVGLIGVAAIGHRALFAWRTMLGTIVLVLLFVPIRRYQLPSALPFNIELYRLLLFGAAILWLAALLADPRIRLVRTPLDPALGALTLVYLGSIVASGNRLDLPGLGSAAVKTFTLFASMLVLYYMIASLAQTFEDIEALVRILAGGGAVVAFFSIIEARTHFNIFDNLQRIQPFLVRSGGPSQSALERGGHLRVLASSEHPIALSAMFVILVPLAAYLAERTRARRWWIATALLITAALGTLSRTGVIMIVVLILVYVWRRPHEMRELARRSWKFAIPLLIAVHFLLPGTLGTFHDLFFGQGGVVKQQQGGSVGSGRLASFWPGMKVVEQHILLGLGYGTRIVGDVPGANSFIVDDGWLSTAMEAGLAAVLAWLWIFCRFIRRTALAASRDSTARGRLLGALTASVASFAVGMATYDAFSFLQVTFVLFILLALGSATLRAKAPAGP
jgi:hypothetical protein